jgi:protein-L-isoaspartate(D-aspartate) O-methyltransferase
MRRILASMTGFVPDPSAARAAMVSRQLRGRGIADERVLAAMGFIPREDFVPEGWRRDAYADEALPIDAGQTISQPVIVARMTELLRVSPGDRILEIGTGSGYQAAVLAEMGMRVFTIERHMSLLVEARKRFEKFRYNIASKCGDGTLGWSEFGPYRGILVTAGAPEPPPALLDQLDEGGVLVIPVGAMEIQDIHAITRRGGRFHAVQTAGFKFVPLIGKSGWTGPR